MVKMSFHFQVLFFHIHQKASKLGAIGNILDGSSYLASSLLLGENNWCFYLSSPSFNNAFFIYDRRWVIKMILSWRSSKSCCFRFNCLLSILFTKNITNFNKKCLFFIYSFLAIPILLRYAKLAIEKGLAQGRDGSYIQQLYMNYFTKLKLYIKQL